MDAPQTGTTIQTGDKIFNIGVINNATFGTTVEDMPFNEYLTKELMEAIKPYCPIAVKYLELVKTKPDWNKIAELSNKAKEIIAGNYVGVIGIQLRKLMAIGKEPISDSKKHNYIETCIITAKRTMQVLCFAFISDFWNQRKQKEYQLSPTQNEQITHFFQNFIELSFTEYYTLFTCLSAVYQENNLPLPLPELSDLSQQLQPDSRFGIAIDQFNKLFATADKDRDTIANCEMAEKALAEFLATLGFLSAYKMISIKSVGYEAPRNDAPRFMHNFISLGFDSKTNINPEKLNCLDRPISTDSVFLYRGDYLNGINLFPFAIDLNALAFESGAKICFYSSGSLETDENTLNYCFLEDNSNECITFSNISKQGLPLNELLLDKEKRKKLKFDTVYHLFNEAKTTILGSSIDLSSLDDL